MQSELDKQRATLTAAFERELSECRRQSDHIAELQETALEGVRAFERAAAEERLNRE